MPRRRTLSPNLSSEYVKNIARSGKPLRMIRHQLLRTLARSPRRSADALNPYLRKRLLLITNEWLATPFETEDFATIQALQENGNETVSALLSLIKDHILINKDAVQRLDIIEERLTKAALDDNFELIESVLNDVSKRDRQSIFFWRAQAAIYAGDTPTLATHLSAQLPTQWLDEHLLYPLIFWAVNLPNRGDLRRSLNYLLSGTESPSERTVLEVLINDEEAPPADLIEKLYCAILAHPYDALNLVCGHIEIMLAEQGAIDRRFESWLMSISSQITTIRLSDTNAILEQTKGKRSPNGEWERILASSHRHILTLLTKMGSSRPGSLPEEIATSQLMNAMVRVRFERLPSMAEHDLIHTTAKRWHFIAAGRLLHAYMASLYMYPRGDWRRERLDTLRLSATPFAEETFCYLSPGSEQQREVGPESALIECETNQLHDRSWIKIFQFQLRSLAHQNRPLAWMQHFAERIDLTRSYLSGTDWYWLDEIIEQSGSRLNIFRGNKDAAYAFISRSLEDSSYTMDAARLIFAELTAKSIDDVISILIDKYGYKAADVGYYFLTPALLMRLRISVNEISALSDRLRALELLVSKVGYTHSLTAADYDNEYKSVSAALFYRKISASQFLVPWTSFAVASAANKRDEFSAVRSLSLTVANDLQVLGSRTVSNSYAFPNEQIAEYKLAHYQWPAALYLLGIIGDFMSHPSFGLEAILSTRIRHDVFKFEYEQAITSAAEGAIEGIFRYRAEAIAAIFVKSVGRAIDDWLSKRIRSVSPLTKDGIFDLRPTTEQLSDLIDRALRVFKEVEDENQALQDVIQSVIAFLQERLRESVSRCADIFRSEVRSVLRRAIQRTSNELSSSSDFRDADVSAIAALVDATSERVTTELEAAFQVHEEADAESMSLLDVVAAVQGRFAAEIERTGTRIECPSTAKQARIGPTDVRFFFDILSEAFLNARKHGQQQGQRLSVGLGMDENGTTLRLSSRSCNDATGKWEVEGHTFKSPSQLLHTEGNSGLRKMAALAAQINHKDGSIYVCQRNRSFHVLIPLRAGALSSLG